MNEESPDKVSRAFAFYGKYGFYGFYGFYEKQVFPVKSRFN